MIEKKDTTEKQARGRREEMKPKSEKMLPKTADDILNGGVYLQRVRCGKSNCRCIKGEKHSAYYFFTRIDGKLRKKYIRKKELESFSLLVDQALLHRKHKQRIARASAELSKSLSAILREKAAIIAALKGKLTA